MLQSHALENAIEFAAYRPGGIKSNLDYSHKAAAVPRVNSGKPPRGEKK
jgi:hypothetical protein